MQDILNLQHLIGQVEINLVPLQDNPFSNSKSELKVFEASIVGTLSIVSPTFALGRAVRDGETGFVAPAQGWRYSMERAIEVVTDRTGAYHEMAMQAAQDALRLYVPEVQAPAVLGALFADQRDTLAGSSAAAS